MSTSAIVARQLPDGQWEGRSIHCDGYPTGAGRNIHRLGVQGFGGDFDALARFLVDEHADWAGIGPNADPHAPTGHPLDHRLWPDQGTAEGEAFSACSRCYCHAPDGHGVPVAERAPIRPATDDLAGFEWTYVICDRGLLVIDGCADGQAVGLAPWDTPTDDVDWTTIECGEQFERCRHYAWVHFPDLPEQARDLSTAEWLVREPLTVDDAIAITVDGTTSRISGGRRERLPGGGFGDVWEVWCPDADGGSYVPAWYAAGPRAGELVDGVELVYPPVCAAV